MEDGRWMSIGVEARGEQRVSAEEPTIPAELSDVIEIKLFLLIWRSYRVKNIFNLLVKYVLTTHCITLQLNHPILEVEIVTVMS